MTNDTQTLRDRIAMIIDDRPANKPRSATDDILAEFVVISRSELPKRAPAVALELLIAAGYTSTSHRVQDPLVWISDAVRCLDGWAKYIEKEAKRNARRDELAAWLLPDPSEDAPHPTTYASLNPKLHKAIDRIIDLEEAAA